eukprot:2101544-Pyramimonas_sp.AAC.2
MQYPERGMCDIDAIAFVLCDARAVPAVVLDAWRTACRTLCREFGVPAPDDRAPAAPAAPAASPALAPDPSGTQSLLDAALARIAVLERRS